MKSKIIIFLLILAENSFAGNGALSDETGFFLQVFFTMLSVQFFLFLVDWGLQKIMKNGRSAVE